ncbi:COP9 signalosome complex subunit 12 [Coprinopsis marcescibilis]|uniref:COP9 signalosome complex subunit 12 n=1 Tax=Coprinopsis marcescibilis TaxID=230819 RepID=A0A5C3KZC5_COPMA|nr:COP9 signalosome complex subunit 12 [Coprinopsis marcescibilis]
MPITFSTYITQLTDAVQLTNGPNLAYLLRPTSPHGKDLRNALKRFEGSVESPWDEIAIQYVLVCSHIAKKQYEEAFKEESQLVSLFYRFLPESRGWTLPALFSILRDLRDLAYDADSQSGGAKSDSMEEAARIITKAFGLCMTDRTSPYEESRKWGIYYVVGLVLKCYFRVRRISLSKNILRALEANNDVPPLAQYPRAHQVTFQYYIGMLSFLNEDFVKAEQELTLAFYHCNNSARGNKQRILTYLIPLRIIQGQLPSAELLRRFPTLEELYSPFVKAIRSGDVQAYDKALERSEQRLLELNLWLTLEKAREISLRSLFRKIWVSVDKSTRMPISMFHAGLKISGIDVPVEEAECYVANMIYRGFMRGYISHEKQMVVLAQTNAFPRVADRPNPFQTI